MAFVCGAQPNPEQPTARDKFLLYARRHITSIEFFLAEEFFERWQERFGRDLLSMEDELASYADCLIVFVESPSAIAELGAFANNDDLARIMLPINDEAYRESRSFIAEGPLAKVNAVSIFGTTIHTDFQLILRSIPAIRERLSRTHRKRGKRVNISNKTDFENANRKLRMLFLYEIVALFGPLPLRDIVSVLEIIFDGTGYDVTTELTLLRTLSLLGMESGVYYHNPEKLQRFMSFNGLDVRAARSAVIREYQKAQRSRIDLLGRLTSRGLPWVS